MARIGAQRRPLPDDNPDVDLRPDAWLPPGAVDALCLHPALPDAVALLLDTLIESYDGNRLLNQVLSDRGRVMVGLYVCFLAIHPRPGDNGVTLSAVQALCRQTGLSSPGRAAALMALMRFGGYIVSEADPADQRKRRIMPSARLLDEHQRRWTWNYETMTPVLPRAARVLSHLGSASFREALLTELGLHYLGGFRPLNYAPALATIAESNAGLLILAGLMLQQRRAGSGPVSVSISAMSRRFCVSRAHVRNVLIQAEAAGLLLQSPDSGAIMAQPPLAASMLRFFGAVFLLFDRCGARALDAWG